MGLCLLNNFVSYTFYNGYVIQMICTKNDNGLKGKASYTLR